MDIYHKIQSIFMRDPANKCKTFLVGRYTCPEFEYLKDTIWDFSEKINGTNIRAHWDGAKVTIGGRTNNAQIPSFLYSHLQNIFTPKKFADYFNDSNEVTLYGEGFGAKIQKGGGNYISDGCGFALFDVKVGGWWLKRGDVGQVGNAFEGVFNAPHIGNGTLIDALKLIQSKTLKSWWGDFLAEGIVARPKVELFGRDGKRIITKIKHTDFI